ncbi:unnamed protein product [Rangifer tarandus platyrhynchus]|uniref:Uncharacterized protein n=2 Tax=Rangifer tarandus platyrhynchus TaxID=3082113 RepID=A0ABN8Y0E0_RANTA|nr:unnamed protein product [Rangifer tarandus platyrhynchus]CAI9692715.1 unnamed protein product [Rangifer tarandus platyrhynchus]
MRENVGSHQLSAARKQSYHSKELKSKSLFGLDPLSQIHQGPFEDKGSTALHVQLSGGFKPPKQSPKHFLDFSSFNRAVLYKDIVGMSLCDFHGWNRKDIALLDHTLYKKAAPCHEDPQATLRRDQHHAERRPLPNSHCAGHLACALSSVPRLYRGDESNITPAVTTTNVPGVARHPWEGTKSPRRATTGLDRSQRQGSGPYSQNDKLQKRRPLPGQPIIIAPEEPPLDAGEGFVCTRWLGQSPRYPAKLEPLGQREHRADVVKTPNSCLAVKEFVLDELCRGGKGGMTKPVGRKA